MKILFYGNCQTEVAMQALAFSNPEDEFNYAGNSNRVARFDPDRTEKLFDWCDVVITQPVMNTENADHHEVLRARFGDKVLFMPYIWLDGFFSLCAAPGSKARRGDTGFHGGNIVVERLLQTNLNGVIQDFVSGNLDFRHAERFESSYQELVRREKHTEIKTGPFIRENYRDRPVMLTHNHPHPDLINEIARQIAALLNLKFKAVTRDNPLALDAITLPEFGKVCTPYCVRDLGLRYNYDLQWTRLGREIITEIAGTLQEMQPEDTYLIRQQRRLSRQAERQEQRMTGPKVQDKIP